MGRAGRLGTHGHSAIIVVTMWALAAIDTPTEQLGIRELRWLVSLYADEVFWPEVLNLASEDGGRAPSFRAFSN